VSSSNRFPSYAELLKNDPPGSAWEVWGDRVGLGALNHLTDDRVARAARLVRRGARFPLGLSIDAIDPPLFGRAAPTHTLTNGYGALHHDDVLDGFNTQLASQWDGFRHVRHHVFGWYGGVLEECHGIDQWAKRGIAGRGVLLDVARWREARGRPLDPVEPEGISAADLDAVLSWQGVDIEFGDLVFMRTGWLSWYRSASLEEKASMAATPRCAGLLPGHATLAWLWDHRVAAIVSDNPTVELWPVGSRASDEDRARVEADARLVGELSIHRSVIPLLGIPLGELFDLDDLAQDCAEHSGWDFFVTAAPLGIAGGAASPANAIAFK